MGGRCGGWGWGGGFGAIWIIIIIILLFAAIGFEEESSII